MSVNGKREGITQEDLLAVGVQMNIKKAGEIVEQVKEVVSNWTSYAQQAGIPGNQASAIGSTHLVYG